MIAAEVELGASSLYNHMSGKQDLLNEICMVSAARFADGLQELAAVAKTRHDTLEGIIRLHVSLALNHPETVTVFNDEWRHLEQPAIDVFLRKRKEYESKVVELLLDQAELPAQLSCPPDIAVSTLLASLSWVYYVRRPEQLNVDELTKHLTALWATGWQLAIPSP